MGGSFFQKRKKNMGTTYNKTIIYITLTKISKKINWLWWLCIGKKMMKLRILMSINFILPPSSLLQTNIWSRSNHQLLPMNTTFNSKWYKLLLHIKLNYLDHSKTTKKQISTFANSIRFFINLFQFAIN